MAMSHEGTRRAPAIALTDTNSMTGVVEFYEAAVAARVKPLVGVELTQPLPHERALCLKWAAGQGMARMVGAWDEDDEDAADGSASQSPALCQGDLGKRLVALARDEAGYHELCEVTTRRMLDPEFDLREAAAALSEHVVVLSDWTEALEAARGRARDLTYGLLVPWRSRRQRNRAVYDQCQRLGLECVVGGDVRMARAEDEELLKLLWAMQRLTTVAQLEESAGLLRPGEGMFLTAEEVAGRFGLGRGHALEEPLRRAMALTVEVAEMCECRLSLREWKFPRFGAAEGRGEERLRALATEGLRQRYGQSPPAEAVQRLNHELEVIAQLGFSDYFLLVHHIVQEARRRGFFTLGRGSAANSIVTYALGISHVCPLRHRLHFERFLNPERSSPPDIDLDFSWRERDAILQWCFEEFGYERVALISTIQTLRMRQAVREVGRAYGFAPEELRHFNRLKSVGYVLEEMESEEGEGRRGRGSRRDLAMEEPWRTILHYAQRLAGWPRHFSIHCGGVVIAPEPVRRWVPLTRSAKGFVITQMDMVGVEALGLVKMDLLSNRSLGVLKDALLAAECHELGSGPEVGDARTDGDGGFPKEKPLGVAATSAALPHEGQRRAVLAHEAGRMKLAGTRRGTSVALAGVLEQFEAAQEAPMGPAQERPLRERIFDLEFLTRDSATRQLIHEGRTMGCFYIESPGMRALFERLRCKEFSEVVAASSIIRPGVAESGMMEEYIARHRGEARQERRYPRVQELLRRLLPETYGVMVYQEDVLLVAHEVAGMSYGEADVLRRAMSGKTRSGEAMEAARERFVRGAMQRHQLTEEEASEIWRQVASFAGYSFCKGHSAAFAVLSYQVAYLKAHYPAEFFAAVLDNGGGFYGAGAYLEEARRWGLTTLGPCVNTADVHFRGKTHTVEQLHATGWVQVGLGAVAEVHRETCERIVAERLRCGLYTSLEDFLKRVRPSPAEARQLVRVGALDCVRLGNKRRISLRERCHLRQQLLLELELLMRKGAAEAGEGSLLALAPKEASQKMLPEVAPPQSEREAHARLCRWEWECLGFMVSGHPLDFVRVGEHCVAARDIRCYAGKRVEMIGWAIAAKELAASNSGRPMKMLTLEDRTDTFEAVLFPNAYARFAPRTLSCGPYRVRGRVDMRLGSPTLDVEHIEVVPLQL
jgi:DNA polymerase III alpha subunit